MKSVNLFSRNGFWSSSGVPVKVGSPFVRLYSPCSLFFGSQGFGELFHQFLHNRFPGLLLHCLIDKTSYQEAVKKSAGRRALKTNLYQVLKFTIRETNYSWAWPMVNLSTWYGSSAGVRSAIFSQLPGTLLYYALEILPFQKKPRNACCHYAYPRSISCCCRLRTIYRHLSIWTLRI
jgi:hypothetical protein